MSRMRAAVALGERLARVRARSREKGGGNPQISRMRAAVALGERLARVRARSREKGGGNPQISRSPQRAEWATTRHGKGARGTQLGVTEAALRSGRRTYLARQGAIVGRERLRT